MLNSRGSPQCIENKHLLPLRVEFALAKCHLSFPLAFSTKQNLTPSSPYHHQTHLFSITSPSLLKKLFNFVGRVSVVHFESFRSPHHLQIPSRITTTKHFFWPLRSCHTFQIEHHFSKPSSSLVIRAEKCRHHQHLLGATIQTCRQRPPSIPLLPLKFLSIRIETSIFFSITMTLLPIITIIIKIVITTPTITTTMEASTICRF